MGRSSIGDSSSNSLCVAALALVAGLTLPATANAQGNGSVTFEGGASTDTGAKADAQATPPAAAPPPAATPPAAEPAAAAPAEGAEEGADAAQVAEWAQRDRMINESNTITGGVGLLRTQHAQSGAPGQFRLGFVSEWFSAGFLCSAQFPCPNRSGGAPFTTKSPTMRSL